MSKNSGKPSKCKKTTNPCKICLQTVKPKTGLQCQGACEAWVHYACLNYTPGKIADIKNGIISVTCPCPDCKTTVPKEVRLNEPFSCNNLQCPANKSPACEQASCQANQVTDRALPPIRPGTLLKCGHECKSFSPTSYESERTDPCLEGFPIKLCDPNQTGPDHFNRRFLYTGGCLPAMCGEEECILKMNCSGATCGAAGGGAGMPSMDTVEQLCRTVNDLTLQINDLMERMRQTNGGGGGGHKSNASSDQNIGYPCPHDGPRELCPKPCHCPENQKRR